MKVSYYPGCSLEGTAREYHESLHAVSNILGIELEELPDWSCCGASSAHATDDGLAFPLAARNLIIADKIGRDLMVPCAACFQRLKRAEKWLKTGKTIEETSASYAGKFNVRHAADLIWELCGEKTITQHVKKQLKGLNPVCYYGCLTTRPPDITDATDPENPESVDMIMQSLGAGVRNWSYKTDCCGGSLMFTQPAAAKILVKNLFEMALEAGANCIAVSCPMCHSNLDTRQKEIVQENGTAFDLPVYYFTELMGLAFGEKQALKWVNSHITEATTLVRQSELL